MRASIDHVVPYSWDTGQRPSFDYSSRCQDLPRMANSCNRLSLLVELSNKVQNLLTQPQLLGALSAWDDEQVEICCVRLVYREGRLDRVPLLPFYGCPIQPDHDSFHSLLLQAIDRMEKFQVFEIVGSYDGRSLPLQRINHLLSPALKLHYTARKNLSPAPRGVSLQPYLRPRDCDHVSIRRFSLPLTFFKPIPGDQEKSLILRPDCQSELTFSGPRCCPREFPLGLNE